ncbi:hypothetical protein E1A91_D01G105900v1, partial [Gossypium mustelinum]
APDSPSVFSSPANPDLSPLQRCFPAFCSLQDRFSFGLTGHNPDSKALAKLKASLSISQIRIFRNKIPY